MASLYFPIHSICKSVLKENMYPVTLGVVLLLVAGAHAQSECPSGYELFDGRCYMVSEEGTCWEEAKARCESSGGILAIPGSQEELSSILAVVSQHLAPESFSVWLGFTDKINEGVFLDVNGNAMVFDSFSPGEPNDSNGEDCVGMYPSGNMNDLPCEYITTGFICTAGAPELEETRCPASWTEFGGDCYRFFDASKTFDESEANCQSYVNNHDQPAHLASIACDEENEFVTELIASSSGIDAQRTWIGGSDRDQEGTFEWTDNKVQEYSNWNVNQPDDNNNEDCIEINFKNHGAWNDLPCSKTFPSICKMPVYDPMTACQGLAEQINKLIGECSKAVPSRK